MIEASSLMFRGFAKRVWHWLSRVDNRGATVRGSLVGSALREQQLLLAVPMLIVCTLLPTDLLAASVLGKQAIVNPNLRIQLAKNLVVETLQDSANTVEPISDIILGTSISGYSHNQIRVTPELIPASDAIAISFGLSTIASSETTGVNGAATVRSTGVTNITGSKRIHLKPLRFHTRPAEAHATTRSEIVDFQWARHIGKVVAWQRAQSQKQQSEKISADRAAARARARFDKEVNDQIRRLHTQVMQPTWTYIEQHAGTPDLRFRTTSEGVQLAAMVGKVDQLPIPPQPKNNPGAVAQVHQSIVNTLANQRFANKVLDDAKQQTGKLIEFFGLPERSESDDDKQWRVELTAEPFEFQFDDDRINVAIRVARFEVEGTEYPGMVLRASYQLVEGSAGKVIRDGNLSIRKLEMDGESTGGRGGRQQIFRSLLRKRVNPIFAEQLDIAALVQRFRQANDSVGLDLDWKDVQSQDGWLTLLASVKQKATQTSAVESPQ